MRKLHWTNRTKIFDPTKHKTAWMQNYAQNPNVFEFDDRLRIYFTTRPLKNSDGMFTSQTAYADFEKNEPFKLIEVAQVPVLELGGAGDFDEFGIMPGSVIRNQNQIWLYYVGWTRLTSVPYKWSVGLAISDDNGKTFKRYSKGPIISSSPFDPYLQACPRVIQLKNNDFLMWYNAGIEWNKVNNHYESVYITKTAHSKDGVNWIINNNQFIPSKVSKECQTSSSFIEFDNLYHLFFSYRYGTDFRKKEKGYRIGYMFSENNKDWQRKDEIANFDVSNKGWDSEMVCYPHVVEINNQIYMFYCGNNFGEYGFGYTKLLK